MVDGCDDLSDGLYDERIGVDFCQFGLEDGQG